MIKLDVDKKTKEGKWFDYDEDSSFKIRPFPLSQSVLNPSGSNIVNVILLQAIFCLIDWKGVEGINGNEAKYSKENKNQLLNYSEELVYFICKKSKECNEEIVNIKAKKI